MKKKVRLVLYCREHLTYGINKTDIYEKYINKEYFELFLLYSGKKENWEKINENHYLVPKDKIVEFLKTFHIDLFYSFGSPYLDDIVPDITKVCPFFNCVNFTPLYLPNPQVENMIISKTDYLKIEALQGKKLKNARVAYNPLDFEGWQEAAKEKENFKELFKGKNIDFIVGRLARAEPTKWHFLMLATLFIMDRKKEYNCGFLFAGMPKNYLLAIKILLSKRMKENIVCIEQLSGKKAISKFYNTIDLFWQASVIGESFGNVIAESFCFKIPVMTDYKNFFRKDGSVNPKRYNAQMELVDAGKNGYYANYPSSVRRIFASMNKNELRQKGLEGYNKTKTTYDIKLTCKTIEKRIMEKLFETKNIKNIPAYYEKLPYHPNEKEMKDLQKEYFRKLAFAESQNKVSFFEKCSFRCFEQVWYKVDFIYLSIRYLLKKMQ